MKRIYRIGFTIAAAALGLSLALVILAAPNAAAAQTSQVDLSLSLHAPQHVAAGEEYTANLAYSNLGSATSPQDTWVSITLPEGTEFISATNIDGEPLPPDEVNQNLLIWYVGQVTAESCCQHILITLAVDSSLQEGVELTIQAEISSSALDANPADNTASVTSLVCDMAGSSKSVNAQEVKPGDILTYTIRLSLSSRNGEGSPQQRMVTLTDTLPNQYQVRFLGWSGPISGTWDGFTLRWQGQVRAGEPLTLQYRLGVQGEVPPGTVITNSAQLGWGGMQMRLGPVETRVVMPPYAHMFGPQGGEWRQMNGATIQIPPNAVSGTTRFEFRPMFTDTHPVAGPPGYMFAHQAFELTAFRFGEIHQFGQPISITLALQDEDWQGLKRETLRLWFRNGLGEPWAMLGEPQWLAPDTLLFTTGHLTEFALFGMPGYQFHLPLIRK